MFEGILVAFQKLSFTKILIMVMAHNVFVQNNLANLGLLSLGNLNVVIYLFI